MLRRRWKARRWELAKHQLEADRGVPDLPSPETDAISGMIYESHRALGGMLNPKAKTTTEWRGD